MSKGSCPLKSMGCPIKAPFCPCQSCRDERQQRIERLQNKCMGQPCCKKPEKGKGCFRNDSENEERSFTNFILDVIGIMA